MQAFLDLLPVILFFVAYKFSGIFVATGVAIATTFALIAYSYFKHGKIDKMLWINGGVISVMGGFTLLLHDKTFIMWKPTVLYWIVAAGLVVSRYGFEKNLITKMLGNMMNPPKAIWDKLNWLWVAFLIGLGFLNLYVAHHYSESDWVNFKLFGVTSLMFAFIILQAFALKKHWLEDIK